MKVTRIWMSHMAMLHKVYAEKDRCGVKVLVDVVGVTYHIFIWKIVLEDILSLRKPHDFDLRGVDINLGDVIWK
ncbi:unnamed protein product [Brugia pahangi]|uniref:Neur_chan_LBD domain-containing protein n=1 Tax=Brugia pahangi TaxID=6280 RepID=A0A0N4TWF6_BRUPA|nr:unnamed protein product [Brugia pahangi]